MSSEIDQCDRLPRRVGRGLGDQGDERLAELDPAAVDRVGEQKGREDLCDRADLEAGAPVGDLAPTVGASEPDHCDLLAHAQPD